jgi:hypothetical protein
MTGHARIFDAWRQSGDGDIVAAADAASLNFDPHLSWPWLRHVFFDEFQGAACLTDLHGPHFLAHSLLRWYELDFNRLAG